MFKAPVSDEEFVHVLQAVLAQIMSSTTIYQRAGIVAPESDNDWDEWYTQCAAAYQSHILTAQNAHNQLVDIKPQREHGQLHTAAIIASSAYLETMFAFYMYTKLWTDEWWDTDPDRNQQSKFGRDAQEWDKIAYEELVRLIPLLESSSLGIEIPKELGKVNSGMMGMIFGGHFISL